jgi:hypothetical protein
MTIELGPGKTKGVSPDIHAEKRRQAQLRKKLGRHSASRRSETIEDRARNDERIAHQRAAERTRGELAHKLRSYPDALLFAEFMLDAYVKSDGKRIDGRLLKPVDVAIKEARENFTGMRNNRAEFAITAVKAELAYQLNQV